MTNSINGYFAFANAIDYFKFFENNMLNAEAWLMPFVIHMPSGYEITNGIINTVL